MMKMALCVEDHEVARLEASKPIILVEKAQVLALNQTGMEEKSARR